MVRTITFAVLAVAVCAAGGCTTVNFGGQGRGAAIDESTLIQPERDLREAVKTLESRAEEEGWSAGDGMAAVASRAISTLLYGRRKPDAGTSERPEDHLADYVRRVSASDDAATTFLGHLAEVENLVQQVNGATNQIAVMSTLDRDAVTDDIRHVERAMTTARRAETFFQDATAQLSSQLNEDQRKAARVRLTTLNNEIARMSDLADALNAARAAGGFEVG